MLRPRETRPGTSWPERREPREWPQDRVETLFSSPTNGGDIN